MTAFRVLIKDSFGERWYVVFHENMELAVAVVRQAVAKAAEDDEKYVKAKKAEEIDGEALILSKIGESELVMPRNPEEA